MMNQPQSATVKSISTKNGRKKQFDFSFASKDKIEEKKEEDDFNPFKDNKKKHTSA